MTTKKRIMAAIEALRSEGVIASSTKTKKTNEDAIERTMAKLAARRAERAETAQREAEAEDIAPVSAFDTNKSSTGIKRGGVTTDLLAPMRESLAGFDTIKEKQAELDELKATPRYVDDGSGGKKYIGTKAASELDNSIKALESEIEGIKDADRLKTLESYAADKTVKSSRTQQLLSGVPSMNGGDPAILGYNTLTGVLKNGVVSSVNARDMTETQRHTYDVLYEQDPKLADDYQKLIESDVRARTVAREIESTKSASKEMPAVGIAANIIGGVAAPLAAAENLFAVAKGEEYDPNSAFSAGARISQASAEGLTEDIENPTLRAAANIGLGAVNYAAQLPLGSFALPMMAASSAGQTSYNARMDGASTKESAALGLIAGGTEAILEKIPLDELFDAFKGVGKAAAKEATAKSVVKAILSQTVRGAVSEGVEETLSEYVNTVADSIIRGDESEVMKYRDELITSGMSEDEANKEAFKQYYLINPAISGAGGALLGGAFRGAATAIGNRSVIAEATTTKAAAAESSGIGISKRITDYPADKQKTIKEYLSSVNQGLLSFIRGVKNGTDGKLERYNISEVTERQATDVKNVLGVDVTGYTNAINSNAVRHIEKRHGRSGEHDTSMSNPEDIARVGYVLENYDGVERLVNSEGFPEKSKEFRGSDNQPSDILRFHKKINGTQYVVEAVADNSYKKLWVVSSYIQKSKDITQESNVSPSDTNNTTSETHPASLSSDKTSIAQYEAVVKREVKKRIAAAEDESGTKLTSAEKHAIEKAVRRDADKGFISVDTIEEALGGETYSKYKKAANSEAKALREYELLADIPANQLSENQRLRLEKLKPRIEDIRAKKKSTALKGRLSDEVAALAKNSRLSESYAERSRRGQAFTADVSKYEGKQREVVQRAIDSGILNNTNRTHEFVDIIARLSADKGVSFDFVNNARLKETGFAVKDATVNGYVDKDGIKINIDSPKAWQSIVGHEVTHVLGETELYAELQGALFDYARKRGDYDKRRDALTKLYESVEGADIDAELTADLAGDCIFTDEAFVRSLSAEHKGVFRRVYDEIKYLAKLVTAGSKEARQLERAKRVFDKVWRESGTAGGVDGVKYSLSANAKTELHKALYDTSYRNEVRLRDVTPEIMLSQKDVRNLPMTMKASHIRENVFTEEEAKKLGLKVDEHTHYHGLGEDFFLQIIDSLDNVTEAYRGTKNAEKTERRENYFLLVSEFKDKNGNTINVPVYIDELANYNRVMVDVNKISTTFGRDGFRDYINKQIRLKNLVRIKNKSTQTSERYATVAQGYGMDAPNGSIPQSSENVNSKFSLSADADIGPVVGFATPASELRYQGEDADIAPVAAAVSDMETVQPARAARTVAHARRISGRQATGAVIEDSSAAVTAPSPAVGAAPAVDGGAARTKQRSWVKTSTDSESVNGAVSPSDLDAERIHYEPISNKVTIANADKQLNNMGYDNAVTYFNSQFYNRRVSLDDVVLGERLIQQAIARGDTAAASELIENVAILGTELGQKVQALSIIKRNTPEGQLRMLKKVVERGKAKGDKCYDGVEITQAMSDSILDVCDVDGSYDQSELNRVVEQVKQRIADQMSVSTYEKLNAWRYLAMLGNPKTHLRNIMSNVAMTATTVVKDVSARTIESIAPIGNRTKTWARASDEVKAYARATTLAERDIIRGGGKYAEEASIKEKRQIFKNKVLDKVYGFNSEFLTTEDWWFSKYAYRTSLQEFLTANGIRTQADIDANPKLVERGKQYALERAQAATFQQYSWLANKIGEMERKNKALGVAVGAVIPFKKTPINIAKTGLSYSPLGFAKTLTYDIAQVKSGKMEASTLVDHLAQNLTGTALTLAGYLLASAGLINGAGEDDKEGEYDYQLGEQTYSLSIGGQTLSLSWLSPVAMPLFVGANAYEQLVKGEEWNGNVVIETLAQTLDPLSEMSFLSGLNDVLSSYESGGMEKFAGIFESAAQTYVTQYVPTLLSQVAAVTDDTKRTTRAAPDSKFEFFDETINKLKYKIPVLRQTLEPSIDIWGNEIKQEENLAFRAFEQFISPSTGKAYIGTEADEELKALYGRTDDSGVLPTVPKGTVGYDGEDYEMSAEEYTAFRQSYGNAAQELLKKLFDTETYRGISNEEKADMVGRVYDYARDEAKRKLLAGRGVEYTNAGGEDERYYKENPVKGAIEHDMTVDEYVFMTDNPEKYEFLTENGVAYTDYAGGGEEFKDAWTWAYKNPDKYVLSKAVTDDLVKYRQYARAISDIVSDKDESGESISGSAKAKKTEYISGLDIEYGQKLILYRSLFDSKADRAAYDDDLVEYLINHDGISYEDKVTIFEGLGFDVSDDGTVTW